MASKVFLGGVARIKLSEGGGKQGKESPQVREEVGGSGVRSFPKSSTDPLETACRKGQGQGRGGGDGWRPGRDSERLTDGVPPLRALQGQAVAKLHNVQK